VIAIRSAKDLDDLYSKAQTRGALILLDVYALWCPPCRRAAPTFARMSEEYDDASVIFAKLNIDECGSIAAALQVRVMPTFLLLKPPARSQSVCDVVHLTLKPTVLETLRGWSERSVRGKLAQHGVAVSRSEPRSLEDGAGADSGAGASEKVGLICNEDGCVREPPPNHQAPSTRALTSAAEV